MITNLVKVIIPIYKDSISVNEELSLRRCLNVLGKHPIVLIHSGTVNTDEYNRIAGEEKVIVQYLIFNQNDFSSVESYNKLLQENRFYKKFLNCGYILIYQLDAWVFNDELNEWCRKGYDYIGAPWFENWHNATLSSTLIGVGNGGFSLRNVKQTIKLIRRMQFFSAIYNLVIKRQSLICKLLPYTFFKKLIFFLDQRRYRGINEDYQIYKLSKIYKWYRIAPIEEGIRFSFDANPESLYILNNYKLPFGCHGWYRYGKNFWGSFIQLSGK